MHVAVILSGSGVYDGSEIHEAVLGLLALEAAGHRWEAFAPDVNQRQVIDHLTGEEMPETRNVLKESARIARGKIKPLEALELAKVDALFLPGGFGAAKNLTDWAINGPNGSILASLAQAIQAAWTSKKPIVALCMAPVVVAKALETKQVQLTLSFGTTKAASPYDIQGLHQALEGMGMRAKEANNPAVVVDTQNRIVTGPCYMMEAQITDIWATAQAAVKAMESFSH